MAVISFELTQSDGVTPQLAAVPAFTYYGGRDGVSPMTPPVIYHRGQGVYVATVPPADAATGVVWLVTSGAFPSRIVGAVSLEADPLVAVFFEDGSGALWAGADPTITLYVDQLGVARPVTPALVKGSRVGVYAFTATPADADAATVFLVVPPAGAAPAFIQGNITRAQRVTFTVTQLDLFHVRLTADQPVRNTAELIDPSRYSVLATSPLILSPVVSAVTRVSTTAVELTLSRELATDTYAVSLVDGTWFTLDYSSSNQTSAVALAATGQAPVLTAAYAATVNTIRVAYSKAMRHVSALTPSDALNPANYSVTTRTVTGVTALSDTLFELALDVPMALLTSYDVSVLTSRDVVGNPVTPLTVTIPYGAVPSTTLTAGDVIGNSVLVPAEWRLRSPFPYATLEFFRQRMLSAVSDSSFAGPRGRCLLFFTQDTDVRAIFTDLFGVTFSTPAAALVEKRGALEVHADVARFLSRLNEMALSELRQAGVPGAYTEMLQSRLTSHNYLDQVSAFCAVVLLAAAVLP